MRHILYRNRVIEYLIVLFLRRITRETDIYVYIVHSMPVYTVYHHILYTTIPVSCRHSVVLVLYIVYSVSLSRLERQTLGYIQSSWKKEACALFPHFFRSIFSSFPLFLSLDIRRVHCLSHTMQDGYRLFAYISIHT